MRRRTVPSSYLTRTSEVTQEVSTGPGAEELPPALAIGRAWWRVVATCNSGTALEEQVSGANVPSRAAAAPILRSRWSSARRMRIASFSRSDASLCKRNASSRSRRASALTPTFDGTSAATVAGHLPWLLGTARAARAAMLSLALRVPAIGAGTAGTAAALRASAAARAAWAAALEVGRGKGADGGLVIAHVACNVLSPRPSAEGASAGSGAAGELAAAALQRASAACSAAWRRGSTSGALATPAAGCAAEGEAGESGKL
mmetsp:Transcript_19398/g.58540  ORF Transcript_19398/g.58540 Transcript_19398/m.58540 type:complete len:260 (-) Transcript_19398:982-1761(-)|eukprot:scaffold100906_cov28-Tisochrysis_lutea.AAC.2